MSPPAPHRNWPHIVAKFFTTTWKWTKSGSKLWLTLPCVVCGHWWFQRDSGTKGQALLWKGLSISYSRACSWGLFLIMSLVHTVGCFPASSSGQEVFMSTKKKKNKRTLENKFTSCEIEVSRVTPGRNLDQDTWLWYNLLNSKNIFSGQGTVRGL